MDPPGWSDYQVPPTVMRLSSLMLIRLLVGLVDLSRRHALSVVLGGVVLAAFSGWFASAHLGVSTDTDLMFSDSLPWRQRAAGDERRIFRSSDDLLVAVVDAPHPGGGRRHRASN